MSLAKHPPGGVLAADTRQKCSVSRLTSYLFVVEEVVKSVKLLFGELHVSFMTNNVIAGHSGWSLELKFIVKVRLKTELFFVQLLSSFVRQWNGLWYCC